MGDSWKSSGGTRKSPAGGRLKKEGSGAKGTDQKSYLKEEGQSKERG